MSPAVCCCKLLHCYNFSVTFSEKYSNTRIQPIYQPSSLGSHDTSLPKSNSFPQSKYTIRTESLSVLKYFDSCFSLAYCTILSTELIRFKKLVSHTANSKHFQHFIKYQSFKQNPQVILTRLGP